MRGWLVAAESGDQRSVIDYKRFVNGVTRGGGWRLANDDHRRWCSKVDRQTFQPVKQILLRVEE